MSNYSKPNHNSAKGSKKRGRRSPSRKKTSGEIVKRHYSNKNDKITASDFESLEIDTSLPRDRAQQPLEIDENKERPKDAEKDHKTITPWDVIGE